ncbi:sugar transferase [Nitriliruptor alkaliphilus]|uniref:sugar transferase n=1 Tax=Nitriliruptor alkaliphilus TaxID=427918 RepID=UPI00146FFA57|nr:sugar transferase [Nitriliruptor alkaliphilus]
MDRQRTSFDGHATPITFRVVAHDGAPAITAVRRPSAYERWAKPVLDRVVAAVLLVVLSPVMAAVALAVAVALGRPVLYRQDRVGWRGSTVQVLKFRTMGHDRRRDQRGRCRADRRCDERRASDRRHGRAAVDHDRRCTERRCAERRRVDRGRRRTHKTVADPRHTRFGRALRAASLDELPQLWNVLRGDLSLVGPRPELLEVVAVYEPWQHTRHVVKPGVTGLWQVTERGDDTPMHHHVDTDLRYIAELSFVGDLRILAATPLVLLGIGRARRGT